MARPKSDLSALFISKATAAQAIPHTPIPGATPIVPPVPEPPAVQVHGGAAAKLKALTVKLDPITYQRLRRYCAAREDSTGDRVTHQEVMVEALLRLLGEGN